MNKAKIKEIFLKALFAAIYAFVAEIAVTQTLDETTLYVTLLVAFLRALIVFFTTIKESDIATSQRHRDIGWTAYL